MKRLLCIPFLFICLASSATNYYIKNGGSDLSSGLSDYEAWATVTRVNSSMNIFKPGDSILFKKGNSWLNSTIVIRTAGIKGNNIVIGSYGSGSKPLIEGSENHSAIMVNSANRGFWTIDNLDLRASGKISGVYNTVSIYHGYWLSNDPGPVPGWIIQNCSFNSCVLLSGPGTIVRNNTFNGGGNINNRGGAVCLRGPECDSCIVELNTITDYYDRGIWIYNGGAHPIFRKNTINKIHKGSDHGGSGINIDGYGVRVTYGEIYSNTISNVDMCAITFENGYKASAYNNRTGNCTGIMIWQYDPYLETGDIDIHHNIFHNGNNGIVIFNAKGIHIANNTFIKNDDLGSEKIALYITTSSTYVSDISFVNNIVAGKWTHLVKVPDLKAIWTSFDYNILFPSRSWIMNRAGKNLSLSQIQSLGYMANGNSLNPFFIDDLSDFHLQSRSPAINTGIKLHYLFDIDEKPIDNLPDIGAFEYTGDYTIPLFLNCFVDDSAPAVLQMSFNTPLSGVKPSVTAFTVKVNSKEIMIDSVAVSGTQVLLTLSESVTFGDTITIAYTKPQSNPIQSTNGGMASNIQTQPVKNNVMARITRVPVYIGSAIYDALPDLLEISYDLPLATITPPLTAFTVNLNSREIEINSAVVSSSKILLTLSCQVMPGDNVTIEYIMPVINPLQTPEGSLAETFGPVSVTNNVSTLRKTRFIIYPNPAKYYIAIRGPENSFVEYVVRITDFNGRPCMETTLKVPFSVQMIPLRLNAGIYMIYILSGSSILHAGKLIVN